MNRTYTIHASALIALPFMLLPGAYWLAASVPGSIPVAGWQQGVIWSLRFLFFGGAFLGWRAGRPFWFYPWLGFAVYAAVAILLQGAFLVFQFGEGFLALSLAAVFFPLAFSPYFAAVLLLGWRFSNRPLAALTVFPHAALTIPLVLLVNGVIPYGDWRVVLLSSAACAAIAALSWHMLSTSGRLRMRWVQVALLFGGVILTQALYVFGDFYLNEGGRIVDLLIMWIAVVGLGWVILSGPFLLPPLVQLLIRVLRVERTSGHLREKAERFLLALNSAFTRRNESSDVPDSEKTVDDHPKSEANMSEEAGTTAVVGTRPSSGPNLDRLYKVSVTILAALAVILVTLYVGRAAVYKIHEFERGLHLRGGRFLGVQMPGWHIQVPLVDTVIIVKVNERLGYVERIAAMTSDNVTMDVSLQYTYRVTDPERFALAVDDPERIVFEFVQGKLRDVINTKAMTGVMNQRTEMNLEIMQELEEKEDQYGVEFITVQIQSASPPTEVLSAIKDRMVAAQRQEQAEAEAAQQRTVADAQFYSAQKEAEAQAYRITTSAAAEAEQIQLTTEAQQLAVRAILSELEGKGALAEKYIDYLIAVELKENSKWILGAGAEPVLELRPSVDE